ncbi:unnamed protein product [Penicillium pancosmium]
MSDTTTTTDIPRHKILTQHCRFCNHLLLATTRTLNTLPRRTGESKDKAIILPLEAKALSQDPSQDTDAASTSNVKHTTVLLSTTIPDRRATLIRREDGIEKLHWGRDTASKAKVEVESEEGEGEGETAEEERPPAVYILPGAVVETGEMGEKSGGVGEMEWRVWGE